MAAMCYVFGRILLIWLAIKKGCEPTLLLPMGFARSWSTCLYPACLIRSCPAWRRPTVLSSGFLRLVLKASEALPTLLFIGIGAMIDFGPLLANPVMFLFGAAAQFGIFFAICAASLLGFDLADAASAGIIGAADGPTAILVSQVLDSNYVGAIAVAAYSYMALVPIIQPLVIKAMTTKKERRIHMEYHPAMVTKTVRIAFPIIVTIIVGFVAPSSIALVGFLMFGNLLRECGVLGTLSDTAQNTLTNLITLLLGITISFSMRAGSFC